MSGKKPDCIGCGYVTTIPENFEAMHLLETYLGFMIDGMGTLNLIAILKIFDMQNIKDPQTLLLKIMIYISAALKARSDDVTFSKSKSKATRKVSKKGTKMIYKG